MTTNRFYRLGLPPMLQAGERTHSKFIVWINEGNGWEEQGEGPMTKKQAERIAREIRQGCGCKAKYLPVGAQQ